MKKRFTEEQIIRMLKEQENGKKAADIVRENNVSEQTFYRWKSKYGGLDVSEAKRLKQLEDENRRLKVSVNTSAQIPSVPEGSTQAAWVRSVAIW